MAGFIYFAEGPPAVPECIRHAFETPPQVHEVVGAGPGGRPGHVYCGPSYADLQQHVGYYKNRQTWRKMPGGEAWVGYLTDSPPTETILKKANIIPGHRVTLGNGEEWTIPIARSWNEQGNYTIELPRIVGVDDDGRIVRTDKIVAEYKHIWEIGQSIFDNLYEGLSEEGEGELHLSFDDVFKVIAANYLVSPIEISILELVTTANCWEIANAVIDLASHPYLKKKAALDTYNSNAGRQDAILSTAPA